MERAREGRMSEGKRREGKRMWITHPLLHWVYTQNLDFSNRAAVNDAEQ